MFILRFLLVCLGCLLAVSGWATALPDTTNIQAYAGIEVGAKGVKMCVVRERITSAGQHEVISVMERTTNTELVSLSQSAIIATAWAVRSYLDTVVETFHIPRKMVFIVVSSGVKQALDKAGKLEEVRGALRGAIDEPGREVFYVRPEQEAELMAEGVISLAERNHAGLCDIGGGNTKGGRFSDGYFLPFSLPYGTRSMLNTVPATDSVPILVRRMDSVYQGRLQAEFVKAATQPALANIHTLYLSGGIAWIMSSFIYPEKAGDPYVELSLEDLKRFHAMVGFDYNALSHPIYDHNLPNAAAIEKMLTQARNTYDRKAVVAGATLAYGLATAIAAQNRNVKIVFDRNAGLSWIRGLVRQSVLTGGRPELAQL